MGGLIYMQIESFFFFLLFHHFCRAALESRRLDEQCGNQIWPLFEKEKNSQRYQ